MLEVGCGTAAVGQRGALLPACGSPSPICPREWWQPASGAVAGLPGIDLAGARTCDAQDLPFDDGTFDVVVANHMLYHVPDPRRAAAEFARVLRPGGVLLAATNGPQHLDAVADVSRTALGWSSSTPSTGGSAARPGGRSCARPSAR